MFERAHHRQIAVLLESLDATRLLQLRCLFGGGTAMALRFGEYRESVDIDFLVSDLSCYRQLRQLLTGPLGVAALCRPGAAVEQVREVRADAYGLRTALKTGASSNPDSSGAAAPAIKFEVVFEARIDIAPPADTDRLCGIATLTPLDMAASKLLANADRWADDGAFSRDLIDLAMMQPGRELLQQARQKAELAYGSSIAVDLTRAAEQLFNRTGRLERCMAAMQMTVPKALLWQRIKSLVKKL